MNCFRDDFWIWGHDAGVHHAEKYKVWNLPGINQMGPVEGAAYLNIPNCCRVVFNGQPVPPFDGESEKLRSFDQVVWSILGDASSVRNNDGCDDLDEVLRQAEKCRNVTGGILDDLFRPATKDARITPERLQIIAERLHHAVRPLSLWIVYYSALLEIDYSRWLESADVITFWAWKSRDLEKMETDLNRIAERTPGKKHYAGCYLWNYGDCRPMTDQEMQFQLELYRKLWHEKKLDGVIVCSNTVADIGLKSVVLFREWFKIHGNETRI